jgi:hypothetical protein
MKKPASKKKTNKPKKRKKYSQKAKVSKTKIQDLTRPTDFYQPIHLVSLSLKAVSLDDSEHIVSGTAVLIASGLAITAKHVIEDFFEKFGPSEETSETKYSLQAMQIIENGTVGALWNILKFTMCNNTDIAILYLTPASESANARKNIFPTIELCPPQKGDKMWAFGFRKTRADVDVNKIKWCIDPVTAEGVVKDFHPEKRDEARLNFPCFQTNAQYDGGMSGGPVFNSQGNLAGIICSNLPPYNHKDEHVSYVSLLYPLMSVSVRVNIDGEPEKDLLIYELCKLHVVHAINLDSVFFEHDKDSQIVKVGLKTKNQKP